MKPKRSPTCTLPQLPLHPRSYMGEIFRTSGYMLLCLPSSLLLLLNLMPSRQASLNASLCPSQKASKAPLFSHCTPLTVCLKSIPLIVSKLHEATAQSTVPTRALTVMEATSGCTQAFSPSCRLSLASTSGNSLRARGLSFTS